MSGLEFLIRPFQTRDISPPRLIVKPDDEPKPDIVLIFGGDGETKTFSGSYQQTVSQYQDAKVKETDRKTETKTIHNPDDAEQKLDVENISKLTTKQGYGRSYQKSNYVFKNTNT